MVLSLSYLKPSSGSKNHWVNPKLLCSARSCTVNSIRQVLCLLVHQGPRNLVKNWWKDKLMPSLATVNLLAASTHMLYTLHVLHSHVFIQHPEDFWCTQICEDTRHSEENQVSHALLWRNLWSHRVSHQEIGEHQDESQKFVEWKKLTASSRHCATSSIRQSRAGKSELWVLEIRIVASGEYKVQGSFLSCINVLGLYLH